MYVVNGGILENIIDYTKWEIIGGLRWDTVSNINHCWPIIINFYGRYGDYVILYKIMNYIVTMTNNFVDL